jgi:hypothetical protein
MSTLGLVLLVVLILLLVGAFPGVAQTSYGYAPSGAIGFILIVVLILLLLGKL